ncbi:MAG: chromosomal replication initiator protein DnaA [Desulfuromonas sp.]|nr:MAG: chromosomal replication initiator protein DnaA [Desulfuromonas sp.]
MDKIWKDTVEQLRNVLTEQNFNTWITPIDFIELEKETIRVQVPNRFFSDWIKENYKEIIQDILKKISGVNYIVKIEIKKKELHKKITKKQEIKDDKETKVKKEKDIKKEIRASNLNPKYTFDEFVSGSSNQFAFAAAMAVAKNPASIYNPLFIYGGVGLGKTHIINAIGNSLLKESKNIKVCYYTSEKFMNELINSIRYGKMDEFRNKFRSMDILLIDDVQFIAGKERTQEEFFHTFNALYDSHKQIVVTSDKFPKEIPGLEERLRSRFEWGLIADIQPPDVETKQAILNMKAENNGIKLSEDVSYFLASSITSNIRELEGYLVRIGAYASLTSTPLTLATVKELLKDILVEKNKEISIDEILKAVCNHYNVKLTDIKSSKRLKTLVTPRQVGMYLARTMTASSYPEIGDKFGGKDHSTIIYAMKKIEKMLKDDFTLRTTIEAIKQGLINKIC